MTRDRCVTDHGAELAAALERARRRCYAPPAADAGTVLFVEPCRAVRPPADARAAWADLIAAGDRLESHLAAVGEPVEAGAWRYSLGPDAQLVVTRREEAIGWTRSTCSRP